MKNLTFCATGHRPERLGGYNKEILSKLLQVAMDQVREFTTPDETIISGMALGWDMAIAAAAWLLNRRLICAIPFKGQETRWPIASQNMYNEILEQASEVVYVSEGDYSARKMHIRDMWMVDRSDAMFTLWDGEPYGGTYNTIMYARGLDNPPKEIEAYSYFNAWELL